MRWWRLMRADVAAKAVWLYGGASRRNVLKALTTDGTFAMIVFRLMEAAHRAGMTPLAMIFNKLNVVCGRCIIGRGAAFGPGFVLVHSYGVVINAAVRGGRDVKIEHLVTVGAEKGQAPVLGDDVFLGAGCKVLGGVKVGSRVKVGANAVVVKDVPDDATAVGIPAEVLAIERGGEWPQGGAENAKGD